MFSCLILIVYFVFVFDIDCLNVFVCDIDCFYVFVFGIECLYFSFLILIVWMYLSLIFATKDGHKTC